MTLRIIYQVIFMDIKALPEFEFAITVIRKNLRKNVFFTKELLLVKAQVHKKVS